MAIYTIFQVLLNILDMALIYTYMYIWVRDSKILCIENFFIDWWIKYALKAVAFVGKSVPQQLLKRRAKGNIISVKSCQWKRKETRLRHYEHTVTCINIPVELAAGIVQLCGLQDYLWIDCTSYFHFTGFNGMYKSYVELSWRFIVLSQWLAVIWKATISSGCPSIHHVYHVDYEKAAVCPNKIFCQEYLFF